MRYLLLAVLVSGCLGDPYADIPVTCRSSIGTYVHQKPGTEHFDCIGLSLIEDEIVAAVGQHMGEKARAKLLKDLPKTHVLLYPSDSELTIRGQEVLGFATCGGSVTLRAGKPSKLRPDRNWIWSALPHEYAHVAQNCDAYSPKPQAGDPGDQDPDHANFVSSGFSAVDAMYEAEQTAQIIREWELEEGR